MTSPIPTQPGPANVTAPNATPWAQQPVDAEPRATQRARRIVEGLPAWEPLPPGEITVHRHRQQ